MARKVFFVLWMTVWPAVALYPRFVTGQPAKPADVHIQSKELVRLAPSLSQNADPTRPIEERLAATTDTPVPELVVPNPLDSIQAPVRAPKPPITGRTVSKATSKSDTAHRQARDESVPLILESPADSHSSSLSTKTHTLRRVASATTAQEEQAKKLIHERALVRAQSRHARLEVKYHRGAGQSIQTTAVRWQQQLTQASRGVGPRTFRRP